jgi:hypothetical protein
MPGVTSTIFAPTMGRRSDIAGLLGSLAYKFRNREIVAGRGEIRITVGGEHGNAEQAQISARACVDCRMHGLRICVHGQKRGAGPRDAFHPFRDGVADVVQLEIKKDAFAGAGKRARKIHPAGESELISDFVETDGLSQAYNEMLGLGDGREIQRHDQTVACVAFQVSGSDGWVHCAAWYPDSVYELRNRRTPQLDSRSHFELSENDAFF